FVWRLLTTEVGAPGRFLTRRREARRQRGYAALSDGLAAVAVGDRKRAGKLAKQADKLLADPALTGLLTAQAAELSGDDGEAEKRLTSMVERPQTALLGLKGLLTLAKRRGDTEAALDYARRAWALGAPAADLATDLFDLQARAGQWVEAEATLDEARKRRALAAEDIRHRQALTQYERSLQAERDSDPASALALAQKAHQSDLTLVEAAARVSRLLHRAGKDRKAAAALTNTWQVAPHPLLVEAWLALAPAETPLQRVKRLEKLVKANPDAADGHMALAEAALAAKLWGAARNHLETAAVQRPSAAIYILLARLEREERQDEAAAQMWMSKVAQAPAEPAWHCHSCGKPADLWASTCPSCGAPDSLWWGQQSQALLPAP
ncbi:MAG: heme biosynthesis protein HemY, partial [Magnetospirillum sp.]